MQERKNKQTNKQKKKTKKGIWVMPAIIYLTEEAITHPQSHDASLISWMTDN